MDSRQAERALSLALEAELAGDAAGARRAIEALRKHADTPEEAVARTLFDNWLRSAPERLRGFVKDAEVGAVVSSWESMAPFPPAIRDRAWHALVERRQRLPSAFSSIRIEVDRAHGVSPAVAQDALRKALESRGVPLGEDAFELGVDLDIEESERAGRFFRVRAQLAFVLSSTTAEPVLRFTRTRAETRLNESAARRFVLRRLAVDAAHAVLGTLRRRALQKAW